MDSSSFGAFFKEMRINRGKTLRQFCLENGFDPGNMSKLERGRLPAPQSHEKLEQYANALGIRKGSDDWLNFFDLAAAESGRIPEELLSDEAVVNQLPVLFRTLRGQKVPDDKLQELIRMIKGA